MYLNTADETTGYFCFANVLNKYAYKRDTICLGWLWEKLARYTLKISIDDMIPIH